MCCSCAACPPETVVTMRHEGAEHDSFKPMPLRVPAAAGARRAQDRARLARMRAVLPKETAAGASQVPYQRAASDGLKNGRPLQEGA